MEYPTEYKAKATANIWPLVLMGGFVHIMSSLVAFEILNLFLRPKELVDVVIFGSQVISALCLVWFVVEVGINIPAVAREWWEQRSKHLQIAFKYFAIYAGFVIVTVGVFVAILTLLEKSGEINPLIASLPADTGKDATLQQLKFFWANSTQRFILSMTSMCVLAPIIEEIFFRRFLFVALRKKINFPLALIVSTSLFMVIHPNIALGAIGGIYLGYVYEKNKSLPANILLHSLVNVFAITNSISLR